MLESIARSSWLPSPKSRGTARLGGDSTRLGLAGFAVALVVFFQLDAGGFTTVSNLNSILLNSVPLLIGGSAAAYLVISGNVDLSIGGLYAVAVVTTSLVLRDDGNVPLAICAGVGIGLMLGLLNGALVRALSISPLIVTLGTGFIYHGIAFALANTSSIYGFPASFTEVGRSYVLGVPFPVWIALAFFALLGVILMRTVFGLRTFAIGGNPTAARVNGIPVTRHVVCLFGLSGFAVGLAGVLTTAQLGSGSANIGASFELEVLAAVILGGVAFQGGYGRPIGVFIGVATVGILSAGMIFLGLQAYYQEIAKGTVLVVAIANDQIFAWFRRRKGASAMERSDADRKSSSQANSRRLARKGTGAAELSDSKGGQHLEATTFSASGLSKRYGATWAARDVSFEAESGQVVCLVGENGAGKSTVIRMLSGVERPDDGAMSLSGETLGNLTPQRARAAGIATVFQDLALCPNLGAAYNLVLGQEPRHGRLGQLALVDSKHCVEIATERMARLGVRLDDPFTPVGSLSGGQRQAVAIARVADDRLKVVILDEPTAALGVGASQRVIDLTRKLANDGAAVVMITHDVRTVRAIADRVVVLHLGEVIFKGEAAGLSEHALLQLMSGLHPSQSNASETATVPEAPLKGS